MAVDDLWFSRKRGADGQRARTRRHGRGKRWRVRWVDPETGQTRTELFDRRQDADRHDGNMRADISRGVYVDPRAGRITVAEYAEQWRATLLHRGSTAELTERKLRLHIVPVIGSMQLAAVRPSHLRGWVKDRTAHLEPSTLATVYHGVLVPLFRSAVADKLLGSSPCVGVRLPEVPDSRYYIARPEEVHALAEAPPDQYRAVVYLAAGCGWRSGEIFGLGPDGLDLDDRQVHVRHQIADRSNQRPYLAPTKTKNSVRTNELPAVTADALRHHLARYGTATLDLADETDPRRVHRRSVEVLFTLPSGGPIDRSYWSYLWRPAVAAAGLPKGFGLRDLRHYFATVLIFGGANVKTVQLAMGHTTPTITLNTYVGYWPDALDQTRSLVDGALGCTRPVPQ